MTTHRTPTLSICIGHYRRTAVPWSGGILPIFPRCAGSLTAAVAAGAIEAELVVADWPSDPAQSLRPWLRQLGMPTRIISGTGTFGRGTARNLAARAAHSNWLFFCDADMLVPPAILRRGCEILRERKAFFPGYWRQTGPDATRLSFGRGHGNAFVLREHYQQAGGFAEQRTWGGEDTTFASWFAERNLLVREYVIPHEGHSGQVPIAAVEEGAVLRNIEWQVAGQGESRKSSPQLLIHQWHPKTGETYER